MNSIHPFAEGGADEDSEMLYIDPATCIDCGACADVCPVDAITSDYDLTSLGAEFAALNAAYFAEPGARDYAPERVIRPRLATAGSRALTVAIIGSGPAGCYTAAELLDVDGLDVRVTMFERLARPWGLARFGVAPDHVETRRIVRLFEELVDRPQFDLRLNVDVGVDLSVEELASRFDAVIFATGAPGNRPLDLAGQDLIGSVTAAQVTGWYNAHPSSEELRFTLDGARVVVVGNGNVALDIARILAADPYQLADTDISRRALVDLAGGRAREIVVLGRRGPLQAAFTLPELVGLCRPPRRVRIDPEDFEDERVDVGAEWASFEAREKVRLLQTLSGRGTGAPQEILLRFGLSPIALIGEERVQALRVGRSVLTEGARGVSVTAIDESSSFDIRCDLVINATGFRAAPPTGVAIDPSSGRIENVGGRVVDEDGQVVAGQYAVGWVAAGAEGGLGSNRRRARNTVQALIDDLPALVGVGAI